MALTAALQHPERYAGVAAFLPSRAPLALDISGRLSATGPHPLLSIFVAQRRTKDQNPSNIAFEWAVLFGAEPGPVRVTRQKPGVGRIDSPLRSGVGLRVLTLPEQVDPFPGPGGADRLARAESERRPLFLDGPGAAWEFFQRVKPAPEEEALERAHQLALERLGRKDSSDDVLTLSTELGCHLRMNILVGEEGELEWLHAGIFTSQTTSFFIPLAAYAIAARTASADSCG